MAEKKTVLTLQRDLESKENGGWTLGTLTIKPLKGDKISMFTLEDEGREVKVPGETRIPAGVYELKWNTTGGKNATYKKDFPDIHKGMIEITGINNGKMKFEAVYIHVGNFEKDTEGCPLVGLTRDTIKGTIGNSRVAYRTFYKAMIPLIDSGNAWIEVIDIPKNNATAAKTTTTIKK